MDHRFRRWGALLAALGCAEGAAPRRDAGVRGGSRPPASTSVSTSRPGPDTPERSAPAAGSDSPEVCRRATNPSFPSVAIAGERALLAWYDGPRTVVGNPGPGRALQADRPMPVGEPPPAGPAIAADDRGALVVSVVAAGAGYRLVGRRVEPDLSHLGPEIPFASGVDARYTPGLVAVPGGFVVAWVDASGGVGRAMAGRLLADGRPASAPRVLSPEASNAGAVALARSPSGVVAAWIDPRLGFSPIYVARGGTDGELGEPEIALTTGSAPGTPFVAAAAGDEGTVLVAYGHMGPLGQDFLSRALCRPGARPRAEPLSRADAYATLRAAAVRVSRGFFLLWDEPNGTGRRPPTSVRRQSLGTSGTPSGEPTTLGLGSGVAAVAEGDRVVVSFRRGTSLCTVESSRGVP